MGLRPAKCYRWDSPAYTRVSNNPSDSFITGIPASKITHFDAGNPSGKFDTEISIVSLVDIQVRHNAMEAARIVVHQKLEKYFGKSNYRLKVRVYPHHVMRENVTATGAGADRVQDGMRKSFGKPIGRAARLRKNQKLMSVYINKDDEAIREVKGALSVATKKLPGNMRVEVMEKKAELKKDE